MAKFKVKSPQGEEFEVTAPDDATEEQVLSYAQAQFAATPEKAAPPTARVALQAAAKGAASIPDLFLGAPAKAANLLMAYGGVRGGPEVAADMPIIENPAFLEPTRTALESVGAIRPEFEPQTAGQRVIAKAAETAPSFALAPSQGLKGLAGNLATGTLSGATGGAVKELTGSDIAAAATSMLTPFAVGAAVSGGKAAAHITPTAKGTLKEAAGAGYVVPPSKVKPGAASNAVESIGGKAAVEQQAAIRNQQVTNKLAAKALGLPETTPLTPEIVEGVKRQAGTVYDKIDALKPTVQMEWFPRFHEKDLGKQLQSAKAQARELWKSNDRTPLPETRAAAEKMDTLAKSIEGDILKIAKASGQPELVKELAQSRKLMAKAYDVERALMEDGNINPKVISNMLKHKKPLEGDLRLIGKFAGTFPQASRWVASVPAPGVSGTDALAAAALGTQDIRAGLLPLLRAPARGAMLSKPMQARLLREPEPLAGIGLKSVLAGQAMVEPR